MDREHVNLTASSTREISNSDETERAPTTREVLEELFHLLEDYAPIWYTEEQHNRILAALRRTE